MSVSNERGGGLRNKKVIWSSYLHDDELVSRTSITRFSESIRIFGNHPLGLVEVELNRRARLLLGWTVPQEY